MDQNAESVLNQRCFPLTPPPPQKKRVCLVDNYERPLKVLNPTY